MGTISVNKLGGLSLIVGPVGALVFYFLQPGGALIDPGDPANAPQIIAAMVANAGLTQLTGVLIPIGLLVFLAGMLALQRQVSSSGNGDALARSGVLLMFVGVLTWISGFGIALAIAGSTLPAAQTTQVFAGLYAVNLGLGTSGGILASAGFLSMGLAISTRDDYSRPFALVASVAAAVGLVVVIIGALDSTQLQMMNNITGIIYLIHSVWMITLGLKLMKQ